ncbi:MAG: hypothetical protein EOO23_09210 [Comamonadaceae bacterium]|nr:MAG: hypothetical protein EOO23_09210 [Comamonadaceae bacterium]
MFRNALRARGEESVAAISEDQLFSAAMKALDFHVGEMADPHRAAIYVLARNCYTGRSVWISPRLPTDREEREVVIQEARNRLTRSLMAAGVM